MTCRLMIALLVYGGKMIFINCNDSLELVVQLSEMDQWQ